MPQKKDIGKFTIQFNPIDPCHQKVIEILNSQGRRKAQFISNAIIHYLHCTQTSDLTQEIPSQNIKDMIIEAVNLYFKTKEKNESGKSIIISQTPKSSESIAFDNLSEENYRKNTELLKKIANYNRKDIKSVLCVETGVVYKKVTDAAKSVCCSVSLISAACKGTNRVKRAKGFHWRYVDVR